MKDGDKPYGTPLGTFWGLSRAQAKQFANKCRGRVGESDDDRNARVVALYEEYRALAKAQREERHGPRTD
jgi:hypothetical protein